MSKAYPVQLGIKEVIERMSDGLYREFPEQYPGDAYGYELDDWQKTTIRMVFLGERKRTTVRACHGAGKTFLTGVLTNMFLELYPPCRVAITGPTGRQVRQQAWAHVSQTHDRSVFRDQFTWQRTKMAMKGHEEETFATWLPCKNPRTIEGFHGPDQGRNLLWIVEESKEPDDAVFESIQGALVHENNFWYISSTCGKASGYFFNTHNTKAHLWNTMWVPYYKSSLVSRVQIEEWKELWGENSSWFRARALAEFPDEDDKIICPLSWCERAVIRQDDDEDIEDTEEAA